jgi:hypothetical protein
MAAQISNLPSFNLQRQPSEKLGRLQLLCNLIPGEHILIIAPSTFLVHGHLAHMLQQMSHM